MRKTPVATLALTIVLLFAIPSLAQRGPSTTQERETAVKVAQDFQVNPVNLVILSHITQNTSVWME